MNSKLFNIMSVAYQLAGDGKRNIHAEVLTHPPSPWHNAPQAPGERPSLLLKHVKIWDSFNNAMKWRSNSIKTAK